MEQKIDYEKIPRDGSLTQEMFMSSIRRFREIMCSDKSTIEQIENQFYYLTQDYFRCDLDETGIMLYETTLKEFEMRKPYLMITELKKTSSSSEVKK